MRNFSRFIIRYHTFFLFLILEILSFYFIFNYSRYHNGIYITSSNKATGFLYKNFSSAIQYFSLKKINNELAAENAFLRSQMPTTFEQSKDYFKVAYDSLTMQEYRYRSARVINNSVNKHFNYLTINKGERHGLKPDMGVISTRGLVGVVLNVSDHYATIISLLNTRLKISARLRDTGFFGSLEWDGRSYRHAYLNEIPAHASPNLGDAVVTSGFSSIFPEDILIGTIDEVTLHEGEGFYDIRVLLSVDFKKLQYVEVVEHFLAPEQRELENMNQDD